MLTELTIKDFLKKVASNDPVPGGGSIAALNGSIASSLTAMVARLTIGKKKYEENEALMQKILVEAEKCIDEFVVLIDKDSEAYDKVFACFKMPKNSEQEKELRSAAIQEATKYAALVPMEVAKKGLELTTMIVNVARLGNQNAVTDATVAMMAARSAVLGALLNVRINLSCLKDKAFAEKMQQEADLLESQICEKEKELLASVNQQLRV